jgi:putative transposase
MDLSELLAKHDQGDFLRGIAEAVLQLIMETDVDGLIGAGRHERSGERTTWRNGYRERALDTRLGTLNLRVPKLRQGSYFPGFLEARKTSEQALVAVIQEAWIGGVSTRRVDELVQAMGLSGISKSTVSKLCKDIDERVGEFLNRPLTGEWPYVWLDATYLKVRQGGRIVPVAAIIAVAANTEGAARSSAWASALGSRDLLDRVPALPARPRPWRGQAGDQRRAHRPQGRHRPGVRSHLAALPRSLDAQRPRACLQRPAHRRRRRDPPGLRSARPRPCRRNLAQGGRAAAPPLAQAGRSHGRQRARRAGLHVLPPPAPDQAAFDQPDRALNKEVKRRADVVGIFPNEASIMRLIGAVLFEQNDEWQTASRYMMVEAFAQIDKEEIDPILSITTKAA